MFSSCLHDSKGVAFTLETKGVVNSRQLVIPSQRANDLAAVSIVSVNCHIISLLTSANILLSRFSPKNLFARKARKCLYCDGYMFS